jgi:exopolysaccharide biosynthesis predicted pyruvyltransferase EpsI
VVTDRFHGVIFAVLAGTPVVALRSKDHKIEAGLQMIQHLGSMAFASSVPSAVEKAREMLAKGRHL